MSNIVNPELIWIEGRCYRANDSLREISSFQEHDLYENDEPCNAEEDEDDDSDIEIVTIDSSRFSTSIHISKHYFGYIIGKKGVTKNRIEHETRTTIKIPRQGQSGDIVIYGNNVSNLKTARRRINMIVGSARMKQKYTHFVSIPMNSPQIVANFNKFKESVLAECPDRGIDESVFILGTKLHLTIGVMCLMDNEERQYAAKLLTEARNIVMPMLNDHGPMKIKLKGLSYMNDDPTNIHVLYGTVEEDNVKRGLLQNIADAIHNYFYKAGFMDREFDRDNIKLHVTLMNSKYRNDSLPQTNARRQHESFDGSRVLDKFANYDFGIMEFNELHLSQRGTLGPDGYYQPTCAVPVKD